MATERLISADGFIEDLKTEIMNLYLDGKKGTPRPREELYAIIDRINEQPTVDAVEVVRCKDCKWYMIAPFDNVPYCCHESGYCGEHMLGLFYCANGERKDND